MTGFEYVIPAVSMGLSIISCLSTAVLWVWQVRRVRMREVFMQKQDGGEEFWFAGIAGSIR